VRRTRRGGGGRDLGSPHVASVREAVDALGLYHSGDALSCITMETIDTSLKLYHFKVSRRS
jgi:hypothetical protein